MAVVTGLVFFLDLMAVLGAFLHGNLSASLLITSHENPLALVILLPIVRRDEDAIGSLDYECMPPKNRSSKAAMDTTERAIAGIRSSFLMVCIIPVKSMSNKIMAIGFLALKK